MFINTYRVSYNLPFLISWKTRKILSLSRDPENFSGNIRVTKCNKYIIKGTDRGRRCDLFNLIKHTTPLSFIIK